MSMSIEEIRRRLSAMETTEAAMVADFMAATLDPANPRSGPLREAFEGAIRGIYRVNPVGMEPIAESPANPQQNGTLVGQKPHVAVIAPHFATIQGAGQKPQRAVIAPAIASKSVHPSDLPFVMEHGSADLSDAAVRNLVEGSR